MRMQVLVLLFLDQTETETHVEACHNVMHSTFGDVGMWMHDAAYFGMYQRSF